MIGTSKLFFYYGGGKPFLEAHTDADMADDFDNKNYTTGYMFTFSLGAISSQSKLQKCVAFSTTELEYIEFVEATKEMLWLKRFFQELGLKKSEYQVLYDS